MIRTAARLVSAGRRFPEADPGLTSVSVHPMSDVGRRDHLGARRLSRREEVFWYLFAGITYVCAAIVEKGLLNWLVGPAWLVLVVWWGPELVDRVRRRDQDAR